MLQLLFHLGKEAFAVDARDIEAVLPLPELEPLALAPAYLAGMLRYQGRIIPVLDLKMLRGGEPCQRYISTRILLVKGADESFLGLLVEQAMDMLNLESPAPLPKELLGEGHDWLVPMIHDTGQGLVQAVDWRSLLTPELRTLARQDGPSVASA